MTIDRSIARLLDDTALEAARATGAADLPRAYMLCLADSLREAGIEQLCGDEEWHPTSWSRDDRDTVRAHAELLDVTVDCDLSSAMWARYARYARC